jgi:transposase
VRLNWPEKITCLLKCLNLNFVKTILDKMDKYLDMKGHQLVMDNASIHSSTNIGKYIRSRGYLPPYSLELNSIEQFLSAVKGKVK